MLEHGSTGNEACLIVTLVRAGFARFYEDANAMRIRKEQVGCRKVALSHVDCFCFVYIMLSLFASTVCVERLLP